jgi:hypothetical protein
VQQACRAMPFSSGDKPYGAGLGEARSAIPNCAELRESTLLHFA